MCHQVQVVSRVEIHSKLVQDQALIRVIYSISYLVHSVMEQVDVAQVVSRQWEKIFRQVYDNIQQYITNRVVSDSIDNYFYGSSQGYQ
jgi:hypothetical protein